MDTETRRAHSRVMDEMIATVAGRICDRKPACVERCPKCRHAARCALETGSGESVQQFVAGAFNAVRTEA